MPWSFGRSEVEAMSAATSIATGAPCGVKRVCEAWGVARSTCYAAPADTGPARRVRSLRSVTRSSSP